MYGHGREKKVDALRVKMIRKMVGDDESLSAKSNVDLGRLPPPESCLSTHLDRCNHRVACYKRAATPIFERPKPYDPDQVRMVCGLFFKQRQLLLHLTMSVC